MSDSSEPHADTDLRAWAKVLEPHLDVLRPAGVGPVAVVIQMHGCGGIQPLQRRYAEAARAAGVAAIVVDSLTPRGIGRREAHLTVCTGLALRGRERARDVMAILAWLQAQSWADPARVAVAGWSHGAWAVMEAFAHPPQRASTAFETLAAVKAAVLVYPYAGTLASTRRVGWGGFRPHIYACLAERDAVVGRTQPARALDRLKADGHAVEVLSLPGATHCFDDDCASDPRTRFRPDLTAQAEAFYARALRASLMAGE